MDHETLAIAFKKAEAAERDLSSRMRSLAARVTILQQAHADDLATPRAESREAYLEAAGRLYDHRLEVEALKPDLARAELLTRALKCLPWDWRTAMPGVGTGGSHFFVRSYRIEDGKPAAYDPFWIDACAVRDGKDDADVLVRFLRWQAGARSAGGKTTWGKPSIDVPVPFGDASEAKRLPCGSCGQDGYVIGYKELVFWGEDEYHEHRYRQWLGVLCTDCPRLALIAERHDNPAPRLHP